MKILRSEIMCVFDMILMDASSFFHLKFRKKPRKFRCQERRYAVCCAVTGRFFPAYLAHAALAVTFGILPMAPVSALMTSVGASMAIQMMLISFGL